MDLTLEDLKRVHPIRDRNAAMWNDYRLLYQGGHEFKRAAGMQGFNIIRPETAWDKIGGFQNQRNRRFLFQWEGEPDPVYETLWQRSEYINYVAPICDYYTQWLFCTPPQIRPTEGKEAPDWFPEFTEDATGGGRSFVDFVKEAFLQGPLLCQRSGWLLGRDHSVAVVSAEDDQVILTPYSAEEICDWQHDCTGELEWILLHKKVQYREFPEPRKEEETYTFLNREMWQSWDVVKNGAAESLETDGETYHDLGKVPFVELAVPNGMWILDKIAQPCIGLYNRWNRLKNAEALACVVQPYLVSADGDTSRVIGEGPIMKLRPALGDKQAEDFGWKTPDVGPLDFISTQIEKARDEIYRIVHQMSLAVDSKAVGAIARSGASKIEDRRSSQILLTAYGSYVAPAMLRTITLLSLIYGDDTTWSIDGFKNFDISSLDEELTTAAMAQSLGFKSATARKRIELRAVGRVLDGEDETTMQTIEEETDEAYDMEAEGAMGGGFVEDNIDGEPDEESEVGAVEAIGQAPSGDDNAIDIDGE